MITFRALEKRYDSAQWQKTEKMILSILKPWTLAWAKDLEGWV
jgi:hypothetical protein